MPTYLNEGTTGYLIKDINGIMQSVEPGESIQTYEIRSDSGLTQTSAAPYWNPVVSVYSITLEDVPVTQALSAVDIANTGLLTIWKVEDVATVTVYFGSTANTPAAAVLRQGDEFSVNIDKQVSSVIFVPDGNGSCEMVLKKAGVE